MKKSVSLNIALFLLSFLPILVFSQKNEWVEQVIIANGGVYEASPPFQDYVTIQTYNPTTGISNVFDQIQTQSVQDAVIGNTHLYVAAQDSIIMYDLNTYQRIAAISDSGISRLALYQDKLIVTKQYPITRFFVEVLNAANLAILARVQNISGDCKGISYEKDTLYVAVNGGWMGTEGKLAVIATDNWQLAREINFGPNAIGINDIYKYANKIYTVNETPYGSLDVGSFTVYDIYNYGFTNHVFNVRIGNGAGGTKNSGINNNLLYASMNHGIGAFNMDTKQIEDTTIISDPGYTNHIEITSFDVDYINSEIYANIGNRTQWGISIVTSTLGDSLTSFPTGINADAIAIEYRTPIGLEDQQAISSSMALYPNPADHYLQVTCIGKDEIRKISIMDITGRKVTSLSNCKSHHGCIIDCSTYPSGLYIVVVETGQGLISRKFIKK